MSASTSQLSLTTSNLPTMNSATITTDSAGKAMPLPLPSSTPVRTASSSTASTLSRSHSQGLGSSQSTLPSTAPSTGPSSEKLSPKRATVPLAPPLTSPFRPTSDSMSTRLSTASGSLAGTCGGGSVVIRQPAAKIDELDRLGYIYSLRVAALHHRLKTPSVGSPKTALGPAAVIGSVPTSPPLSNNSSPPIGGSAFGSFRAPVPITNQPLPMRRKKSALTLRLGVRKDELKIPRECLPEFWAIISNEQGDAVWAVAVRTFLGQLQKKGGTKTASGANLREVSVLYTTFSACLPKTASLAGHQSRFLTLLYNALPKCAYFSTSSNQKDQDLLFRLRAEVQTLLSGPGSPTAVISPKGPQFSPELAAHGMAAKASAGLGLFPASPASPASSAYPVTPTSPNTPVTPQSRRHRPSSDASSVRRKPIPRWTGPGEGLDNLVEAVGAIWGISEETLEHDAQELDRYALEKLYLDDLKRSLTQFSRHNQGDQHRSRHSELSKDLGDLLAGFPELAIPSSPAYFLQGTQESYFTPPRTTAVFARLSRRAKSSNNRRAIEVVDRCQKIWGVEGREQKERELENLIRQWDAAVRTDDEPSLGERLADAAGDLVADLDPDEDIPGPLEELQSCLMEHFVRAIHGIFPLPQNSVRPPRPPPSLLPLFDVLPAGWFDMPGTLDTLDELANDLRGAAVDEYVLAAREMMGVAHTFEVGTHVGPRGKDAVVEGFESVAEWMKEEISNVERVWPSNYPINPAAIVIDKQLPLFLAELQVLETASGATSDVFALYEVTSRLLATWDRLCPGGGGDFDIDAFFEPHVLAWLRETETNETSEWVARTVAMDQWLPEGEARHSQSVVDLFEFIRKATQTVRDLPVGEYKRAVYMIDLAKTASTALEEYAQTVSSLFKAEVAPAKITGNDILAARSTSGQWLAKSQFARGKLDAKIEHRRNRSRGSIPPPTIPEAAYVKLTNMGSAGQFVDDLSYALEAEESARVLRDHKFSGTSHSSPRQVVSIRVVRGQNILTRGGIKPADSFVAVVDRDTGARIFKSRTVLETEDPKWDQSFEVSISSIKTLEVLVYDRQLMGKHEAVGSRVLRLNPAQFDTEAELDVVLPMSPRGMVSLRISTIGRERHDVGYHIVASKRVLERTASDMQLEIIDRLGNYLRTVLCPSTLGGLVKQPFLDRKRAPVVPSDAEIDASLVPVFDYLDDNLAVINATCAPAVRERLCLGLWERIVDILLSLLLPPLSDRPLSRAPLSPPEVDIVFKWLQALMSFFNAEGAGVSLSALQGGGYRDMLLLRRVLDLPTPELRDRIADAVKAATVASKETTKDCERVAEVLLRVLRMRSASGNFLATQLAELTRAKVERGRAAGVV